MRKMQKQPLGKLTCNIGRSDGKKGDIVYIWTWIGSRFVVSHISSWWDKFYIHDTILESHCVDHANQKFKDGTFR